MNTHCHLALRLRMGTSILLPSQLPFWHRQGKFWPSQTLQFLLSSRSSGVLSYPRKACFTFVIFLFIIRHAPLHSAVLHAVLISYYIHFTLLHILLSFPWALSLLSSLLCIIKVYCVDKGTELLLVLRYEVLFSHWPGSYLLLNDFPLCAKVWAVEQEVVHCPNLTFVMKVRL